MATTYTRGKLANRAEPQKRLILEVARDIVAHWPNVNYAAQPYLNAMLSMTTIDKPHGQDDARSVITYFLGNATMFRGEHARRLKQELKDIANIK